MTPFVAPSRRDFLVATAAATAFTDGCVGPKRRSGWLNYLLGTEPDTLDPAKSSGGSEAWIISSLFEPLLQPHPETMAPMAGLAISYRLDRNGTRYTFYLRGHQEPEGIRLALAESLPVEFSHGFPGRRDLPARWSDGRLVTAADVVYTWRRCLDPETACPFAYLLSFIEGAEEVNTGKAGVHLAVSAIDTFTLQVDLRAPAPYFPMLLCSSPYTFPLPRHAIEAAKNRGREASWVEPGNLVSSGPFRLLESRPREYTAVEKNWSYFDADLVGVEGIRFSSADGVVVANLFEAGFADSMDGRVLPLQLAGAARRKQGFHIAPACASHTWRISTKHSPLDNVLLRYALNMATDKEQTARVLGTGQRPAIGRVPPMDGYPPVDSLPVAIGGRTCDVLAFDPRAARELWDANAPPQTSVPIPIHHPTRTDSKLLAEVLQDQWRRHLGLQTSLIPHEGPVYGQNIMQGGDWSGVAEDPYIPNYPDPTDLLGFYKGSYPNWSDPGFDRMLTAASSTPDASLRMRRLSECERELLRSMPFIPLYFDTWVYLERQEVHGLGLSPLGVPAFKFAWIEGRRVQ